MIAVGIVGGLLALPAGFAAIVLAFGIPCSAIIGARWLESHGHRLRGVRILDPGGRDERPVAGSCVAPDIFLIFPLFYGYVLIVGPAVLSIGVAWARLATQEDAVPRRSPPTTWLAVIALSLMPPVTFGTFWPLRLGFVAFRPALDRLADQVAAGQASDFPRWVGPFRVARAAVDPSRGTSG